MLFGIGPLEIIGILFFFLLVLLLPGIMRNRLISGISKFALEVEKMVENAQEILIKISKENGKPTQDPQPFVENFMEFFIIPPVELDPYGIVNKFDKILEMGEERFEEMVNIIAPAASEKWKANIIMTLKATIGINSVAKMIRHNLELAKKTGNLQILLMLQMSLPLIMRIVKAQFEGTKAFSEGKPIGDGLGPLVASMLMKDCSKDELQQKDDVIYAERDISGRKVTIVRAKGPGARVGKIGKVITSLINEKDIDRLLTIDAAVKLEGEKSGTIAEGIGVVIGGTGVDKWMVEEQFIKKDLKTDAIIVKMSPEEAISEMTIDMAEAAQKTLPVVERSILRSKEESKVMIVGVGNSCGLPNTISDISQIKLKKDEKKEK
ncbi:MAG: hypothetical protein CIT01_08285 [Methanobacterium sp. BRmetb2]|nr:MAG: hypothetical protein CIT01_08285 [Methanobacterium sp. BRmetb2]